MDRFLKLIKKSQYIDIESKNILQIENDNLATQINSLQIEYNNSRSQINELTTQLADQIIYSESLFNQNKDLQQLNAKLQNSRKDGIFSNLTLYDRSNYTSTLVDSKMPQDLIKMLSKHFEAIYNADIKLFKSTLVMPDYDYLIGFVKKQKEPYKLKVIATWHSIGLDVQPDHYDDSGQYVYALILRASDTSEDKNDSITERDFYTVGVTKKSGEWLVYDYDGVIISDIDF